MTAFIITLVIAMGVSFMCSVLEACLLSLSLTDIARISEKKPTIGKIWVNFKQNIGKPIAVILIINTLAHTIGASLSGAQFQSLFGPKWIWLYSLVFSLVMIEWTEILPKTLAVRYNRQVAVKIGIPLKILVVLFSPLVYILQILNKPFQGKKSHGFTMDAMEELSTLTRFASLNKLISKEQEKILSQTINLSKLKIHDLMVHKDEMKCLLTTMSLSDALIEAHMHHHTRFPLKQPGPQVEILGYVNFKDIISAMRVNPIDPSLKGICRKIHVVYEDESISPVLTRLIKGNFHIAIVKNRSEEVVGMVTLEDLIESIVGDIGDEYDLLPMYVHKISPHRYLIGCGIDMQVFQEKTGMKLSGSTKKMCDWLLEICGHMPKVEEKIVYNDMVFTIRKISHTTIHVVLLDINDGSSDTHSS